MRECSLDACSLGVLARPREPLGGLVYLWLLDRKLHARIGVLSNELEEANQTLNRLSGLDTVTSLANHSSFQEFLRGEWRRALREAYSISVLMIDVDRFSVYNDLLGHQTGDECLVKIGRKIKEVARRPGDLVARYGGEEFGVVMSRTDSEGAFQVAHRICRRCRGTRRSSTPSRTSRRA